MPRDSIRTLVMSAEKDAVKRFISRVHQSWDQLQVETDKVSILRGVKICLCICSTIGPFFYTILFGNICPWQYCGDYPMKMIQLLITNYSLKSTLITCMAESSV